MGELLDERPANFLWDDGRAPGVRRSCGSPKLGPGDHDLLTALVKRTEFETIFVGIDLAWAAANGPKMMRRATKESNPFANAIVVGVDAQYVLEHCSRHETVTCCPANEAVGKASEKCAI